MFLSLVVPVYNEEDTISFFYEKITSNEDLNKINFEIIFINDGSVDSTENVLEELKNRDIKIKVISFTRNFGKETALMAGLEHSTGDAVIPIDVDLQDPIYLIPDMIKEWENGADIVLAKR